MPTGTGAANLRNLPLTKYAVNPGLFNQLTSRTVFAPGNFPLPAFGNYVTTQLLQVGIVAGLRIVISGTITTTGAPAITPTAKWPWGLIQRFTVSGNGQNDFISCDGWDLHIRQLIQNRAMIDSISAYPSNPAAAPFNLAGVANFTLQFYVPIAMDLTTLVGALYAQSEATNLTYRLQVETAANLFSGIVANNIAIAATVFVEEEIYEVPYDPQHSDTLIIPDLTVLHGLVANENAVAQQAVLDTQLFRIQGQLERLFFRTFDPAAATVFTPTASYNFTQLLYGANQAPYTFNPQIMLRSRNNQDYRMALQDGIYVMDMVSDNPARDQVLLEGVTNLRLRNSYAVVPGASAVVHFVQETLFA